MNERAFTEDFPALAEPLVVDRIDHVDDGMAVAVVLGPDGADATLAAEIPELEHCRGQGDLPSCAYIQYSFMLRCPNYGGNAVGLRCVLFWPTVGAILSGGSPGVSLYIVFIFSRSV